MTGHVPCGNKPAVAFCALLLLAPLPAIAAADTMPVETVAAVRETTPLQRVFDGQVEAVHKATISAQTAGRVAEIYYDVNDYVEAGADVMRFTNVEQAAALRQAEASLKEADARARQAAEEFRRTAELYESGSASRREYDRALASRDAANARVRAAQSAVAAARQGVDYTVVRAPYGGIVTERFVEVGESVTVGRPLMSGLSLERLRVVVDLPQQVMARVRASPEATVLTDEGRVAAESVTIFPFADSATNTFRVRVDLPAGQFGLYPGMFVKVAFVVGRSERLLVPKASLVRRSEVTAVYVVNASGAVRLRQVRVGNTFGERVEILGGLAEGEKVAVDPIRAGILVNTTTADGHAQ